MEASRLNDLLKKFSGPRLWVAYTLFAATVGGVLLYLHYDHSQAQKHYEVGQSYMRLVTEPEAKERAMRHLHLAAELGHTEAQRVLGTIYLEDFEESEEQAHAEAARRWLELAAMAGDLEAEATLKRLPTERIDDLPGG